MSRVDGQSGGPPELGWVSSAMTLAPAFQCPLRTEQPHRRQAEHPRPCQALSPWDLCMDMVRPPSITWH